MAIGQPAAPRAADRRRTATMDRKQMVRLALGFSAVAIAVLAMPSVAFAQEAGRAAEHATFLTSQGAAWLGGAIGAGLAIMGGAAGIGRIGGAAGGVVAPRPPAGGPGFPAVLSTAPT